MIYDSYTDASNYGAGVFMRGAGFSKAEMDVAGGLYALAKSQGGVSARRVQWWNYGFDAAASGQFPKPSTR